ncbi:MAG: hypothetical protein VX498_10355 [Myxococcota bacterium]|nr:hypothetical protein [Myxococcota bacterium]
MIGKSSNKILIGLVTIALSIAGCTHFQSDTNTPEGTWNCVSQWSLERNGTDVPRSAEQQSTCTNHQLSTTGVISIGGAQWSETKEGTCYASSDELYGTWTSVQTVPINDAARQFEHEKLGGISLAMAARPLEPEYRVRVTSRTDTQLEAVNGEGRVISCTRL